MRTRKKKKSIFGNLGFWVIILLVIGGSASGWLLWRAIYPVSPRFDFILVKVNDEPQKIFSGETLSLHPHDRVKVSRISTNLFSNQGVRLVAKGFDVNALCYQEVNLSALLPEKDIFDSYSFRIWIKYRNENLGHMDWQVHPYAEDWLDKAERTIDNEQRLAILERALQSAPNEKRIRLRLLDEYKALKRWKKAAEMLESMVEKNPDPEILTALLGVYAAMKNNDGVISVLEKRVELNPNDLEARNQLAEVFEKKGDLENAVLQYEDLLKRILENERLPIYLRLGYLYTEMNQFKKAIFFYLKAVELDEKDANLYYNLSFLYEKSDQKEKADVYLEKAVSLESRDLESRLKLAQRLIIKKETQKAEEYVSQVLDENPRSLEGLLLMAQILEQRGAKEELKDIYRRILSLQPKNETVTYNLGALEYETGKLAESLKYFKKYSKLRPKDTTVHEVLFDIYKKQNNAQMAFKEANILVRLKPAETGPYHFIFDFLQGRKDYEGIIPVMENGLEANPKETDFMNYLALAYLKTGRELKKAKNLLSVVLNENPDSLDTLALMAQVAERLGEKKELIKIYKKILALDPKNETVVYNLGVLEYENGNLKESLKFFGKYLDSHEKDTAVHEIVFDIYKKQNEKDKAFKEAKLLIDLEPSALGPYHYVFNHLSSQGNFEEIISIMEKGIEANPKQIDLRGYLILAYLETGREDQASKEIEEILKVQPDDIKLLLHLARIQEKRGNLTKALKAYEKVIQLSAGHEEAEEAYLRLRLHGVQSEGKSQ